MIHCAKVKQNYGRNPKLWRGFEPMLISLLGNLELIHCAMGGLIFYHKSSLRNDHGAITSDANGLALVDPLKSIFLNWKFLNFCTLNSPRFQRLENWRQLIFMSVSEKKPAGECLAQWCCHKIIGQIMGGSIPGRVGFNFWVNFRALCSRGKIYKIIGPLKNFSGKFSPIS